MSRVHFLHRATLVGCSGIGCRQGDFPHLCDCELNNDIPLRQEFPAPAAKDPTMRATVWSVYTAGVLLAVVALILACWPGH